MRPENLPIVLRRYLVLLLAMLVAISSGNAIADDDVVFCIDTSGSMEDLLDSARARIWDVINELARMSPTPDLHVGLVSYGTEAGGENDGWIVKHAELTDDLDHVYAMLMALTVKGSDEYVGRVLHEAVRNMNWSRDPEALKIIFVAGNESADQEREKYDFREAALRARSEGIIVNALFAGSRNQGIAELWDQVARLGEGNFSAIDPAAGLSQIATPHDDGLIELNASLNQTYLPYGKDGEKGLANQVAQDRNASRLGVQSCSSRIVAKGSSLYTNASWDLVDASLQGGFDLARIADDQLPEAMRSMSAGERASHVDRKRAEREAIQQEIQQLSDERERFVRAEVARQRSGVGLDDAMREAIRSQALAKGFKCDDC